jgi:bacterioferritin (cytochrome b1)
MAFRKTGHNGGAAFSGLLLVETAKRWISAPAVRGRDAGADRFKQHAQEMQYPQFREKLLHIATDKGKHAEWIAEKIAALGGKLPEVAERRSMDENSWQYLLTDLKEENRSADHLPEQIWSIESDHRDITAVLQRIYEEEKNYRGEIREMLMRSDSFALSLA